MNEWNLLKAISVKEKSELEMLISASLKEDKGSGIKSVSVFLRNQETGEVSLFFLAGRAVALELIQGDLKQDGLSYNKVSVQAGDLYYTEIDAQAVKSPGSSLQLAVTALPGLGKDLLVVYEITRKKVSRKVMSYYTCLIAAVTTNILLEKCKNRKEKEKDLQLKVVNVINSSESCEQVFEQAAEAMSGHIPFDLFTVSVRDDEDEEFEKDCSYIRQDNGEFTLFAYPDNEEARQVKGSYREEHKELTLMSHEPKLLTGEEYDNHCSKYHSSRLLRSHFGLSSHICFTVRVCSYRVLLTLSTSKADLFTAEHVDLLSAIRPQLSLVLNNLLSFEEIEKLRERLELENKCLIEEVNTHEGFEEVIGSSPALQQIFHAVNHVARTDSTVLILGETGTGKELFARAVHTLSPRKDKVMIKVNCAALPANLIESELFGHEKGSFTGAFERRIGKFELADKGTLFLDEIGELSSELQAKLLRVLQEKEFERIGGNKVITSDVRIIAATNRDLRQMVEEGKFRADLYYRLNVFPVHLPPLRERKEDIPLLANYFAQKFLKKMNKPFRCFAEKAMMELMSYNFPGNIRELQNIIEHAAILSDGRPLSFGKNMLPGSGIRVKISPALKEDTPAMLPAGRTNTISDIEREKDSLEREKIVSVLARTNWRIRGEKGAAKILDIKPTTLEARMKKLGIIKKYV